MKRANVRWLVAVGCVWVATAVYGEVPLPPLPSVPALASGAGVVVPLVHTQPLDVHELTMEKHGRKGVFDLRFVNVGQVIDLLYDEGLKVPHVISSDVLQDDRVVSFEFDTSKGDLRSFVMAFLDSLGFKVETRDGVDFVSKKAGAVKGEERVTYVYQPRHRSAAYLENLIAPLFAGRVSSQVPQVAASAVAGSDTAAVPVASSSPAPGTGAIGAMGGMGAGGLAAAVTAADDLVFAGSVQEVEQVKALLPQLDTAVGEVVVRGWAYEVDDTDGTNTGFNVASKLLGVGMAVSSGSTAADPNALSFSAGRLSFAISAMNQDSRFKEMSSPNVRCVSGQQVKLNVGQQVPTVSSISYQGTSGTPVQSIAYQDAGVIFDVTPTVMQDVIELDIDEEISSFENTTTGVNSSPTKNTRSLQTVSDLKDGEVIVLGGLIQNQDTASHSGERFLPAFLDGHTTSKARTEVVLVLQVEKI